MNATMLLPFISLASGILIAFGGLGIWAGVSVILLGSVVYRWILCFKKNPVKNYRFSKYHWVWIALWFVGTGIILGDLSLPYQKETDDFSGYSAAGGLVKEKTSKTSGDRLIVSVFSLINKNGNEEKCDNFKLLIYADATDVEVDDEIVFPSDIERITDSDNHFENDFSRMLAAKGIYYQTRVAEENIITIGHSYTLMGFSGRLRDRLTEFFEKRNLDRDTRYFLITILLGDRSYLDEESRRLFANGGIAHLLALSGMHVGIIAGIILFLLFPVNFTGRYKLRLTLTAVLLWGYAFVTGLSPSIVRACVMSTFAVIAIASERKGNALNALCLSGFVILLFDPMAIRDIGFQLSFLCVVSLILFMSPLNPISKKNHPRIHDAYNIVLASIVTTFSSWVVAAYYFHRFPLMFLPTNVVILPLIPFYIIFSIIYLVLSALGFEIHLLGELLDIGYSGIKSLISVLSGGEEYNLCMYISGFTVFIWLSGTLLFALYLNYRRRILLALTSAAMLISGICLEIFRTPSSKGDGFIITNSPRQVEIRLKSGLNERTLYNKASTITLHCIGEKRILVLDCNPKESASALVGDGVDYLVLTQGYHGNLKEIRELFDPDTIVLHNSIRRKREAELISEADTLSLPLHSIRRDRPLKVLLDFAQCVEP